MVIPFVVVEFAVEIERRQDVVACPALTPDPASVVEVGSRRQGVAAAEVSCPCLHTADAYLRFAAVAVVIVRFVAAIEVAPLRQKKQSV